METKVKIEILERLDKQIEDVIENFDLFSDEEIDEFIEMAENVIEHC